MFFSVFTDTEETIRDKLFGTAIHLIKNSVAVSTQRTYASALKKWRVFMQVCHHHPTEDFINCHGMTEMDVVRLLLMFVTFCLDTLGQKPPTIPVILSGLRHHFKVTMNIVANSAFDNSLLVAMKAGISRLDYVPTTRMPCTFDMVQYIIQRNTAVGFTKKDFVKAVAVAMAYYLCLRSSEYVSRTATPQEEAHQFDSQSVEFQVNGRLIASHQMQRYKWHQVELVKFTLQHAKNIKGGFGVPIWYTVEHTDPDSVAFLQLTFLWSQMSTRLPDDPFLSFRSASGHLECLTYKTFQKTIKECAVAFGFNPDWFNPHSVRMAAPTALRAAGGSDRDVLFLGRWKSIPTSLTYSGSSAANNNRLLQLLSNPNLFTSSDILLGRVLPPTKRTKKATVRRF